MASNLPQVAEEQVLAEDINRYSGVANQVAGETISGATTPAPCFKLDSDNEWYKCDANDEDLLDFQGFATSNGTNGNAIRIQSHGIVTGFTGLTEGAKYYVQDDGSIGTTIGTYEVLVGIALSTTTLLILKGSFQYMGSESLNVTGDINLRTGTASMPTNARFAIIQIAYTGLGDNNQGEIFISRKGKTSGSIATGNQGTGGAAAAANASLSGNTITVTSAETASDNNAALTGSCYFYQ